MADVDDGQISPTVDPAISLNCNVNDIITRFGGDGYVSLRRGFGDDMGWLGFKRDSSIAHDPALGAI